MISARETLASAADRRLALRMRPDLSVCCQSYGSRRYWLVKDPVALRYFHLGDEEHAILKMLDGTLSLQEIKRRFEAAFAPLQLTLEQLHGFIGHLVHCGLLLVESPGQGAELLDRRNRRRRLEWLESIGNVLAIRFRGVDPDPLLRWLDARCAWLFSSWFLAACLVLVVCAATLAAVQFDVLAQRLSASKAVLAPGNLLWLAAAIALAKTLHELGHALACKHFGGECHEIGILLLVFTPCLYCDVSDAWLLASKWQRIAVAAAGICVEIVLAAACLLLWWFSEPGLLNTLLLNVVVVCSVNTVLLNGNPLLRYDGYYVLADLIEVPNLSQQARSLVGRGLARVLLGDDRPAERYVPERLQTLVATYAVASVVYRWFVVAAILWVCYGFLQPYGLEVLAGILAVLALAGMLAVPLVRSAAALSNLAHRQRFPAGRLMRSLLVLAAIGATLLLVPLPFRVSAPVMLEAQGGRSVYVVVPGTVTALVVPGQKVEANQPLARLDNLQIAKEIADLTGQRDQQRLRLQNLRARLADDPAVAPQIPAAEEALADVEARLQQRRRDESELVLRAPVAGTVIPGPWRPAPAYSRDALPTWRGGLLDPRTRGAYLETGTLFCTIGDPARLEGVLVIDQADMKFVRQGQDVRMKLDPMPGRVLEGTIAEISKLDLKAAPRELAGEGGVPVRLDRAGIPHPANVSYQTRVELRECPPELLVGARGQAKILAAPQSLAARLYRRLVQVFRFAM
jgi:putative peptide zinc metalloprotease protein